MPEKTKEDEGLRTVNTQCCRQTYLLGMKALQQGNNGPVNT